MLSNSTGLNLDMMKSLLNTDTMAPFLAELSEQASQLRKASTTLLLFLVKIFSVPRNLINARALHNRKLHKNCDLQFY